MRVQQTNVDVIANNLANVNTSGYKRTQADFQDLLYVVRREPGAPTNSGFANTPSGIQIGSGAELLSTTKVFTPGVLEPTGSALDFAIQGDGFFVVDHPNGQQAYTRDGALRIDANGSLTTAQGFVLSPAITVPVDADVSSLVIAPDGTVSVRLGDSSQAQIGQLQLARYPNPAGLRAAGGNLFFETASSGAVQLVTPGEDGAGHISQNTLERSNVDVVNELVNLITAQRAYEVNSRAIRAGDEMLSEVNNLIR
jgi:flagellar basal-body rod protein FlgG